MSLKNQITEDMKEYMKSKDTFALEAIRMLRSDIKNAEIDAKKEFTDDDVIKLVQSTIKKNREAADIYKEAGRTDLMDKELKYSETLAKYLPKQLSETELKEVVNAVIAEMGDVDPKSGFGVVMKAVLAKVGNNADGKAVSSAVRSALEGK